jgi:hypothetical protein
VRLTTDAALVHELIEARDEKKRIRFPASAEPLFESSANAMSEPQPWSSAIVAQVTFKIA